MKSRDKLLTSFGKKVLALRTQAELTQEQLGEKSNLHPTYISGIERGIRNSSLLIQGRLARALDISISELFNGVES